MLNIRNMLMSLFARVTRRERLDGSFYSNLFQYFQGQLNEMTFFLQFALGVIFI